MKRYDLIYHRVYGYGKMRVRKEGEYVKAKPAIANEKIVDRVRSLQDSLQRSGSEHNENDDEYTQSIYLMVARQIGEILD
jgi:hypothetical protein